MKSPEELAILRAAGRITADAMAAAVATAGPGVSENAIAAAVWSALVTAGGEFPGLPPFIVSGPRSSLGHATCGGRRLAAGDVLNFVSGVLAPVRSNRRRCPLVVSVRSSPSCTRRDFARSPAEVAPPSTRWPFTTGGSRVYDVAGVYETSSCAAP